MDSSADTHVSTNSEPTTIRPSSTTTSLLRWFGSESAAPCASVSTAPSASTGVRMKPSGASVDDGSEIPRNTWPQIHTHRPTDRLVIEATIHSRQRRSVPSRRFAARQYRTSAATAAASCDVLSSATEAACPRTPDTTTPTSAAKRVQKKAAWAPNRLSIMALAHRDREGEVDQWDRVTVARW